MDIIDPANIYKLDWVEKGTFQFVFVTVVKNIHIAHDTLNFFFIAYFRVCRL